MGIGIAIDLAVVVFALWSCWRGWRQGLLYQLGQAAVIALAWVLARGVGGLLSDPLMSLTGLSGPLAGTIGFFTSFLLLVVIGSLLVRRLTKNLLSFSETATQTNRALGIIVGGAKGLLIAYLVVVGLMMAHRLTNALPIPFDASLSGRWVRDNNFLNGDAFPRARAVAKVVYILGSRNQQELANDPHIAALIAHPKASLLQSPEVIAAAGNGDVASLLDNGEVWAFLDDPEIQQLLDAIEWRDAEPSPQGETTNSLSSDSGAHLHP